MPDLDDGGGDGALVLPTPLGVVPPAADCINGILDVWGAIQ